MTDLLPAVKSLTFCFYVSGHGWGHATRANQIIMDILKLPAKHKVYVISTASDFIFQGVIKVGAIYRQADVDAGVVQPLPYTVDRYQTIENLKSFLDRRVSIINNEMNWLKTVNADCVICDATFLPCTAAKNVGIPAVLSTNFTFDEIFLGLCEGDELDNDIHKLVKQVIKDYQHADLLIRLPGAIRIPSFDNSKALVPSNNYILPSTSVSNIQTSPDTIRRIIDVPLVFRKFKLPRTKVLDQVGIPKEIYNTHKILLLSFGGQLLSDLQSKPLLPPGWICIVCAAPDNIQLPSGFYRAAKDAYVPDLTNACDVLLGKLGYGTCSECIGHRTPFVYVSRPQFIEERGLLKLMNDQGSAVELSREDFEAGNWTLAIERASAMSGTCLDPQTRISHQGGEIAAQAIENFVFELNHQQSIESLSVYHPKTNPTVCVTVDN